MAIRKVCVEIVTGELKPDSLRYKKLTSTVVYLVSPDYGYRQGPVYEFGMNPKVFDELGVKLRYSATKKVGENAFRTVGSSRNLALSSRRKTPQVARSDILNAITEGFSKSLPLDFRRDIGSKNYISKYILAPKIRRKLLFGKFFLDSNVSSKCIATCLWSIVDSNKLDKTSRNTDDLSTLVNMLNRIVAGDQKPSQLS